MYILRHAKSDHNVQNFCAGYDNRSKPTQEGLEKTHKTGKHLAQIGVKFDRLYVSPLERALLTAQVLLKHLPPVQLNTEHALAERNFGAFTGMSKNSIKEKLSAEAFDHYLHNPYFFPPNIGREHKYFQSKELYGSWPANHQGESYQCVIYRLS
ncbi:MAG: phosphoglycerate mutase family protein [Legionellaceae bacterium]